MNGTKKHSEGDQLRLKVLQIKPFLPMFYAKEFIAMFPEYDTAIGLDKVRGVVNLRIIDAEVTDKLEQMVEKLKQS